MLVEVQRYISTLLFSSAGPKLSRSIQDISVLRATNTQSQALSLEQLDVVFGKINAGALARSVVTGSQVLP